MIHYTVLGIFDGLLDTIYEYIGYVLYLITIALGSVLEKVEQIFFQLLGTETVIYKGEHVYLEEVFFNNSTISHIYYGMLLIGVVLCIVFTIAAVIRKAFDRNGKRQETLGDIIISAGKAILIMLIMTFVLQASILVTRVLVERISYLFDESGEESMLTEISFTDEQYATMARIYNTIGNYSLNSSNDNRLNVNACFNEIRLDLQSLSKEKVFDFTYLITDADGYRVESWQSVLREIALSRNLSKEMPLDVYDERVHKSITHAMEAIKNGGLKVLSSYSKDRTYITKSTMNLDKICILTGTFSAARDDLYNKAPSLTDAVRGPYYSGEKSLYNPNVVWEDFYLNPGSMSYLTTWVLIALMIIELFKVMFVLAARIYNILVLYIVSPLAVSVSPFDGGAKFKTWTTAFTGTMLTTITVLIPIRLYMVFVPIIMSSDLELSSIGTFNITFKVIILLAGVFSIRKATELLNQMTFDGNVSLMGMNNADGAMKAFGTGAKKMKDFSVNTAGRVARGVGSAIDTTRDKMNEVMNGISSLGSSNSGSAGAAPQAQLPNNLFSTGEASGGSSAASSFYGSGAGALGESGSGGGSAESVGSTPPSRISAGESVSSSVNASSAPGPQAPQSQVSLGQDQGPAGGPGIQNQAPNLSGTGSNDGGGANNTYEPKIDLGTGDNSGGSTQTSQPAPASSSQTGDTTPAPETTVKKAMSKPNKPVPSKAIKK